MRQGITLILLLGLVACAAAAGEDTPTLPHGFSGGVTIGGSPAPVGTVITAMIGGTECGSIRTTETGEYGNPGRSVGDRLLVKAAPDQKGKTITFYVDGVAAEETSTFAVGGATVLDLNVPGSGGNGNTGNPGTPGDDSSTGGTVTPRESAAPTASPTAAPEVQIGQASLATSAAGEVIETVAVRTADGIGTVTIREGTTALDAGGNPIGEVTCREVAPAEVPAPPPGTTVAVALNCGPAGATFDPPAVLTYTLSAEEWAEIGGGSTLTVMWYNPASKAWQEIAATVDPAARTITAEVAHFSIYALAWTVPATAAAEAQQTGSPGTPTPTGGEPPWPLIGIGAVILIGAAIGGFAYLRRKD